MELELRRGSAREIDSLMPLWVSMVEHHRSVAGADWPVRDADAAWRIRRAEYRDWLADGSGLLFVASPAQGGSPLGYALLRLHEPGATWDLGEQMGEVESLAVVPHARSAGVGTRLLEACRDELRTRGIAYWSVAVVEANAAAVRLYQREGFRPYYRLLLGDVGA